MKQRNATKAKATAVDAVLQAIAAEHLGRETLQTRNSDSLDFFDCHVGNLREALKAAFEAGREAARHEATAQPKAPATFAAKLTEYMCDNISYVSVRNGSASLATRSGIPLALSNVFGRNAEEFRLRARTIQSTAELVSVCQRLAEHARLVEPMNF